MPPRTKAKTKAAARRSPMVAVSGAKRALSPGEESTPKRVKAEKSLETPAKSSPSVRSSARRGAKAKGGAGSRDVTSRRRQQESPEERSPSPEAQNISDGEWRTVDVRRFIDDEAVDDSKEDEYDPTEPEEEEDGSVKSVSPEPQVVKTHRLRRQHAKIFEDTGARAERGQRETVASPVPEARASIHRETPVREGAPPKDLGALTSLVKLISETPELLTMLANLGTVASTQAAESSASRSGGKELRVSNPSPVPVSLAGSPDKGTREDVARKAPAGSQAGSPAKSARDDAAVEDDGDDSKFDGKKNCLDHELWIPELRGMYRKIRPPPRIIHYVARSSTAGLVAPSLRKWTKHPLFGFMKQLLEVGSTSQYVNISRMPYRNLRVEPGGTTSWPLNYLTRRGTTEPALFMSLVEVKKSSLIEAELIPRRDTPGHFEKKVLIANLFRQEFELLVCNLGCIYNASQITLPSWSGKDEDRGLTFHTKVTVLKDSNVVHSSPSKRGLFDPSPSTGKSTKQPVQIVGAHRVPIFDASVDGFDLNQSFEELQMLPDMEDEPAPGSLGVVFYTISDTRDHTRIEFNIHAFAYLAEPTVDWSDSE